MMALFSGSRGGRAGIALVLGAQILSFSSPLSAADINVVLDQARLVKLPERVATIVIGNPLVADISLQGGGGTMVVTGKSYGVTNLIALDRAGAVLMNSSVEVKGPNGGDRRGLQGYRAGILYLRAQLRAAHHFGRQPTLL